MNRLTFEQSVKALSKPPQKKVEANHEKLINEVKARRANKDTKCRSAQKLVRNTKQNQLYHGV